MSKKIKRIKRQHMDECPECLGVKHTDGKTYIWDGKTFIVCNICDGKGVINVSNKKRK